MVSVTMCVRLSVCPRSKRKMQVTDTADLPNVVVSWLPIAFRFCERVDDQIVRRLRVGNSARRVGSVVNQSLARRA